MNPTIDQLVKIYATGTHKELSELIDGLSKDTVKASLIDLLTLYMNDRNSSTLREYIAVRLAGFNIREKKLGYNGYRQLSPDAPEEYCEAKPVNIRKLDTGKYNRPLDGGGNFSDYTPERLEKDLDANPKMVIAGFADGKLLYVLVFPFSYLQPTLSAQLQKHFGGQVRQKGSYLRSANFSYIDYKDCDELQVLFRASDVEDFASGMKKGFYSWLVNLK